MRSLTDRCSRQLRTFFIALQFFTRLPIPRRVGFDAEWLRHATRYFPLVGAVVGVIVAAAYALALRLFNPPLAVLLSTIVGVLLTGAIHEDGFADVCDGLGGGASRERALLIMKDSCIGVYGAVGVGLMLALKCLTLTAMPPRAALAALLLAHPLSRFAATVLIWRLDYARQEDSKAKAVAQQMSATDFVVAALCALAALLAVAAGDGLHGPAMAAGILTAGACTWWLARMFVRRLGGYTGDCLGAVQQVSEGAFYLGVLACMH